MRCKISVHTSARDGLYARRLLMKICCRTIPAFACEPSRTASRHTHRIAILGVIRACWTKPLICQDDVSALFTGSLNSTRLTKVWRLSSLEAHSLTPAQLHSTLRLPLARRDNLFRMTSANKPVLTIRDKSPGPFFW